MGSLDFWKQVKEAREILKKNKANYQTITISDDIFNMLYKDAERNEKLEKVWEIVDKKQVAWGCIIRCQNFKDYNKCTPEYDLTETEFNLLKEMLDQPSR